MKNGLIVGAGAVIHSSIALQARVPAFFRNRLNSTNAKCVLRRSLTCQKTSGSRFAFGDTSHMKLSGLWEGHGNSILSHAAPFLLRRRLCPWRTCQLPGLIAPHLPCHKSPTITKIRQRGFFDLFRAKTQPELSRPGSLRMKPQKTRTTVP